MLVWRFSISSFAGNFLALVPGRYSLVQGGMSVADYEAQFCQLSRHASSLILSESERVRRFVRGMTPAICSYVFRSYREGTPFQTVVSTAREAELLDRDDFV